MAHTIQGGVTFDAMAAKMLCTVVIPTSSYTSDTTFQSIQALAQALIDQGASARTLTSGGTINIKNYTPNGTSTISSLEPDYTQIPVNGEVGGLIDTFDENNVPIQIRWSAYYLDQTTIP